MQAGLSVVAQPSPGSTYHGRTGNAECVVLSVIVEPESLEPLVTYQNSSGGIACCEEHEFLAAFQL